MWRLAFRYAVLTEFTGGSASRGVRDTLTRIGVTGHRVLAEIDKVEAGIERALDRIQAWRSDSTLTLVSTLAAGADQLVARAVLRRPGGRLIAVLPLPRDNYLLDYSIGASRSEFLGLLGHAAEVIELPLAASREHAYEAGGLYVLNHCEVLLAVWDGQAAQGQGGTGDIVREARRRGLPLAWVHAGNRMAGTMKPTSLGAQQGTLTLERFGT